MNVTRQTTLRKLRPPSLEPVRVIFPFQRESPPNYGYTLEIETGRPVVAPGDGVVDLVVSAAPGWRYRKAATRRTTAVRIDHGLAVKTYVHGVTPAVTKGAQVTRGQLLGYATSGEVFFAIEVAGSMLNPAAVNGFFTPRDGTIFYQQANFIRQAPTVIRQTVTADRMLLYAENCYFLPGTVAPVRFNLNFNGANDKSGAAVIGTDTDVWQDVAPVFFGITGYSAFCGYSATLFSAEQGFFLNDYRGQKTKVYFERGSLTSNAGTTAFFDPMLSSWIGGYSGMTPLENTFTIRNLPGGTYRLYLYANGGTTADASTFYVQVDAGSPVPQTNAPTVVTDWVEGENYALYDGLVVLNHGRIEVRVYGYLSGLQLERTAV